MFSFHGPHDGHAHICTQDAEAQLPSRDLWQDGARAVYIVVRELRFRGQRVLERYVEEHSLDCGALSPHLGWRRAVWPSTMERAAVVQCHVAAAEQRTDGVDALA